MRPRFQAVVIASLLLLAPSLVHAHERFIRHDLKNRLQDWLFARDPTHFLGMNPNMTHIGLFVTGANQLETFGEVTVAPDGSITAHRFEP